MVRFGRAVGLFALLTVIMTWPQAARIASSAQDHQDVFFNMWRLAWWAHAIGGSPRHILDGNIFYPERHTLTLSDAMPVEGVLAAPLFWSGLPPVLIHNLVLLSGIVLSAAGIFMLVTHLTGSGAAGITAGIIFGFVPYRFEHYMHMELQWTVWVPWAFWALHRAIDRASRSYGALTGVFVALQFMSSVYYGVFLATLLALYGVLLLCGSVRSQHLGKRTTALVAGGATAALLCLPYALPYAGTKQRLGPRPEEQVSTYSARPGNYVAATGTNYLYAKTAWRGRPERRLFPGLLAVLLAVVGLLLRPPSDEIIAYLLALVAAFEMSLGLYGYSFTFLYHHVPIFDALRAPARLGIFVVFFLAVLAGHGHAGLEAALRPRARRLLVVAIGAALLLEYWVAPLSLVRYDNLPPPLYAWLARQGRGVVAEFPAPVPERLPGHDARYAYMSTFHWMPLINGYSGYYPSSYLTNLSALRSMPDDAAVQTLMRQGVRYVVVHTSLYSSSQADEMLSGLARDSALAQLGRFDDGLGTAVVFVVR